MARVKKQKIFDKTQAILPAGGLLFLSVLAAALIFSLSDLSQTNNNYSTNKTDLDTAYSWHYGTGILGEAPEIIKNRNITHKISSKSLLPSYQYNTFKDYPVSENQRTNINSESETYSKIVSMYQGAGTRPLEFSPLRSPPYHSV